MCRQDNRTDRAFLLNPREVREQQPLFTSVFSPIFWGGVVFTAAQLRSIWFHPVYLTFHLVPMEPDSSRS